MTHFGRVLATATTAKGVEEVAPSLKGKITPCKSGPRGGDIQIATEVLAGRCDVVVFFLDPMRPHPHADDIRVVLGSCMVDEYVRILTNEVEAREWMEEVVRPGHLAQVVTQQRTNRHRQWRDRPEALDLT